MARKSMLRLEIDEQHTRLFGMLPQVRDVLDVGIGGDPWPGANYEHFKECNYETIDIDPQWRPTHAADICDSGLPDASYDLVILSQTLEHIYDMRKALRECWRILRPGASLIVDVPWIFPYHPEAAFDDFWRVSAAAMRPLLEECGFTVRDCYQGEHGTYALARR